MATYYVDSAGSNTSPYDTLAKAATDFQTVKALEVAGDTIYVRDNYAQTLTSNTTWIFDTDSGGNPTRVISIDASENYSPGATIGINDGSSNDITINYSVRMYGVRIRWGDDFSLNAGGSAGHDGFYFENCTFEQTQTNASNATFQFNGDRSRDARFYFKNCTFELKTTNAAGVIFRGGPTAQGNKALFEGCTWTGDTMTNMTNNALFGPCGDRTPIPFVLRGCDFSEFTGDLVDIAANSMDALFERCAFNSSVTYSTGTIAGTGKFGNRMRIVESDEGTVATYPSTLLYQADWGGTIAPSTSKYRTGGATKVDGTAYAWEITPNSNLGTIYNPLISPRIARYVQPGSQTLTCYMACDETLTDGDAWIEVESPNETEAKVYSKVQLTRVDPEASSATLTTDSDSTWNGSDVGTLYKFEVEVDPLVPGFAYVRFYLAKDTTDPVVFDPIIEVSY